MELTYLYMYGTLAHGALSFVYFNILNAKHREKFIYLLGHLFITIAMFVRIFPAFRASVVPSIAGTIGHSLLLFFFLLVTFVFHNKYHIAFSGELYYLNILCILGQIGMILTYWYEYYDTKYPSEIKDKSEQLSLKILKYVMSGTFIILSLFYIIVALKGKTIKGISFNLIMIGILYVLFIYKQINTKHN